MKSDRRVILFLASWTIAGISIAADGPKTRVEMPLLKHQVNPKEFGIVDDTITVVSAASFTPRSLGPNAPDCNYTPTFGLDCDPNNDMHFYAGLDLPAGAVIDFIGLNSLSDTDGILGVELWSRDSGGNLSSLAAFSVPAHGWATDLNGPLSVPLGSHDNHELVIDVENASSPTLEFFAWVEVWWHRTVNVPPGAPTFNDVPVSDPAYEFIEALASAGITSGCGGGNYCPDNPLTRRQMAVFLSKALGLHWPH